MLRFLFVSFLLAQCCFADDEVVKDELKEEEFGVCEKSRRESISNFLHAEKGRVFSNEIASWEELQTRVKHARWLPVFFEEGTESKHFSHFFLLEGNFTANQAQDACQRLDGSELASLHTQERRDFADKYLVQGNYWIGLHRWSGCPYFTWSTGHKLAETDSGNWFENEPKEAGTLADCVRTVTPTDIICNATFCHSNSPATWSSENCETAHGYSVLCETPYPRPLYGMLPGKFTHKEAEEACKTTFKDSVGANLAMPKHWAAFDNMLNGVNLHYKKWHCWIGMERYFHNDIWMHRWSDGSSSTRFSHQPRPHGQNYTMYPDDHTCVEVYDRYYSKSLDLPEQGWFHYNKCDAKLDCAICEWYWPF